MLPFLKFFSGWLNQQGIIPEEVKNTDTGDMRLNKTYLMVLPTDVSDCYCIRQYNQRLPQLYAKEASVRYIQIIVKNHSHATALEKIDQVYNFLIHRPDYIEDLDDTHWAIIDCQQGPEKLKDDAQRNYVYSISFAITTNS